MIMVYHLYRYMVQGIGGQEINIPEIRYYDTGAAEHKKCHCGRWQSPWYKYESAAICAYDTD